MTTTTTTPNYFITAKSWNGTEFYFNTYKETWEHAEHTVLTNRHEASEQDIVAAEISARRENFAAIDLQLVKYEEAI